MLSTLKEDPLKEFDVVTNVEKLVQSFFIHYHFAETSSIQRKVVGIIHAANSTLSVAMPIDRILTALDLELPLSKDGCCKHFPMAHGVIISLSYYSAEISKNRFEYE